VAKEADNVETKDSGKAISPALLNADTNTRSVVTDQQEKDKFKTNTKISSVASEKEQTREKDTKPKAVINDTEAQINAPTISNAPPVAAEKSKEEALNNGFQKKVSAAKQEEFKAGRQQYNKPDGLSRGAEQKRNVAASNQSAESIFKAQQKKSFNQTNVFRGRVTDGYNNALPFSNITNTEDSIGTYSDARGYFILTSPDSILNVQVRSLGFESNNVQLLNNVPNNNVLLQEDRSSLAEVVISNKKPNSNRLREGNMVLQEPEPADGWNNYDLYLANNLKVPENFKDKQTSTSGEVELSFEVDKDGEPFNITVKKSLCESCDREAIRLIKEGPKWKRKAKRGKATVKIAF
ncbi:MAG TPA: carboxypeptidase-like regulatory domain-containing protein, partial [Chitinophagaceae bacterium]|nr:carboxypeptidase-like regulatory domain-containing protein [Chitinophagaceae bacterium]